MHSIQQCNDYTALSERASDYLLSVLRNKPNAVICLATGGTPLLAYRLLVEKITRQHIDVSKVTIVKLDEWVGVPLPTPGTCESFLQQHIVQPLGLRDDQLISFRSEGVDEQECERITRLIADRGGLDVCVLGIGKNGHLGLNEPAASLEPLCHISPLAEPTRRHSMLQTVGSRVEYGITLGLKDILAAKAILLLVAGEGKQTAVENYLSARVTTDVPASLLWLHNDVTCLLDGSLYGQ